MIYVSNLGVQISIMWLEVITNSSNRVAMSLIKLANLIIANSIINIEDYYFLSLPF